MQRLVSTPTPARVKAHNLDTLALNVKLLHDLRPVLEALEARGIRAVALKGFALLHSVYADSPGVRPMVDVDLLVEPRDLLATEQTILSLGFTVQPSGEWSFVRGCGRARTKIDLHDGIWYLTDADLADFIDRSAPTSAPPTAPRIPAPEDHLVFIAAHAVFLHGQLRAPWLQDLRRLIEAGIDWQAVLRRARRGGVELALELALREVRAVDGGSTVDTALVALGSPLRHRWRRRLLAGVLRRPEIPGVGHVLRHLARASHASRFRVLRRQLLPGSEFIRRRYGVEAGSSCWRAAVLRPFRLAHRGAVLLRRYVLPGSEVGAATRGETR